MVESVHDGDHDGVFRILVSLRCVLKHYIPYSGEFWRGANITFFVGMPDNNCYIVNF